MNKYSKICTVWFLSDCALFIGSYSLAYFIRVGFIFSSDFPYSHFLFTTILAMPMCLASLVTTRTYAQTRPQYTLRNGIYIFFAIVLSTAAFTLINYFVFELVLSRMLLFYCMTLSTVSLWLWHIVFDKMIRNRYVSNPLFRALVIGANRESSTLIESLLQSKNLIQPVAILDGRGAKENDIHGVPVKGKLNKLEQVLTEDRITHLIQCSDLEQSLNLLSACRHHECTYMLLPSVLGIVERDERIEALEGQPVTMVSPTEKKYWWFFR